MVTLESEKTLKTGEKAPHFKLRATDGKIYCLDDFTSDLLLIIFMCNHCPYVIAKFERIKNIQSKYVRHLTAVGINPNDPLKYPEDSFENMVEIAEREKFNFYYLIDETQEIARKYGAVCTPDPFLFDKDRRLIYHGRLDDALNPYDKPKIFDIDEIIDNALNNKPVDTKFKPSRGCSIKWRYNDG